MKDTPHQVLVQLWDSWDDYVLLVEVQIMETLWKAVCKVSYTDTAVLQPCYSLGIYPKSLDFLRQGHAM